MLSRVADSIFWIARSMERAESLARLLQANQQLLLDAGAGQEDEAGFWMPILRTTGDEEVFHSLGLSPTAANVAFFLTENRENPNSITNSILTARENARMIRDQISDEIWQCLNLLHHNIRSNKMSDMLHGDPTEYYERVMRGSYLFQGIARSTMSRSEGWLFLQMGTYLERADKTSRLVDTCSGIPLVLPPNQGANPLRWASLLHSCSAYHAFHELSNHLDPPRVLEFLFLSNDFPRSVRYAVNEVDTALRAISPHHPGFARSDPLRVAGRLKADLDFTTLGEILDIGLHEYIDRLQDRINALGQSIFEAFVFYPDLLPLDLPPEVTTLPATAWHVGTAEETAVQQQQQQQQ